MSKQYYFKQFSLAYVLSLSVKNISISSYSVKSNSSNSKNSVLVLSRSIFIQIISSIFFKYNLVWVHSLIVKKYLFQAIQFIQTILIQPNQFSISKILFTLS